MDSSSIDDIIQGIEALSIKTTAGMREAENNLSSLRLQSLAYSSYNISFTASVGDEAFTLTAEQYIKHVDSIKRQLALFKESAANAARVVSELELIVTRMYTPYSDIVITFSPPTGRDVDIRKQIDVPTGNKSSKICTITIRCTKQGLEINDVGAGFLPISSFVQFVALGSSPQDLKTSTMSWKVLHKNLPISDKYHGSVSYPIATMLSYITGTELDYIMHIRDGWHYSNYADMIWTFKTNVSTNVMAVYIG